MDADMTVLRSGRRWRRAPPPQGPKQLATPSAKDAKEEAGEGKNSPKNPSPNTGAAAKFCCNICLDTAKDPVVTHCGHLFCWPCLYRWVHLYSPFSDCTVCKSAVEIGPEGATVTPIYDAGTATADPAGGDVAGDLVTVPPRPQGRQIARHRGDTPIGEVIEEMRQRADLLGRRVHFQTINVTRAAIDRVRTNLLAVDELVREVSMRAAGLVAMHRVSPVTSDQEQANGRNNEEIPVEDGSTGTRTTGRTRRRDQISGTQVDGGEDRVYRNRRRTEAVVAELAGAEAARAEAAGAEAAEAEVGATDS